MIKALLLILRPVPTWEDIVATRRRWPFIFALHLLPLLLLTAAAEGYGLIHWGKPRGEFASPKLFPLQATLVYETAQLLLSIAIVFLIAKLIKSLGETFHGRHTFNQTFTVAAYSFAPLFLFRLLDASPAISPWLSWAVGILLTLGALYHGLPRVLLPDPPHAFGLYVSTAFLLLIITGLARLLTACYLEGLFPKLDTLILNFLGQ